MKLIKTQNKFILVNDEEIKEGDFTYHIGRKIITKFEKNPGYKREYDALKKIIAGIPSLPSIDFSDLKEEDCKRIGFVDVEELAYKYLNDNYEYVWDNGNVNNWLDGFKTAQSLNDKMFSLEDMRKAILMGRIRVDNISPKYTINEIIQSLQQTSWDVEVEMDKIPADRAPNGWDEFPKITNGKIKITKIL